MRISITKPEIDPGMPCPIPGVTLRWKVSCEGTAAVYSGSVRLIAGNIGVPPLSLRVGGSLEGGPQAAEAFLPLPPALIRSLDASRRNGSLHATCRVRLLIAALHPVTLAPGKTMLWPTTPREEHLETELFIHRDQWLALLNEVEFDELAVFEFPITNIRPHPDLDRALTFLQVAERHHRNGDARDALAQCRAAFEHVMLGLGANPGAGATALFSKIARDDAKLQDVLNELLKAMSSLQHLGRHASDPLPPISSAESLLVLRQSLALFEYLASRLPRP